MKILIVFLIFFDLLHATLLDLNYNEKKKALMKVEEDDEFEPVTTLMKDFRKPKNLDCDDFTKYALNCTADAALIYNSSRMAPPQPMKINDWCSAIRHLTHCALNWNTDCKDVSDRRFNDESIKGHIHVVNNICDDEWFQMKYDGLTLCVESSADSWEICYINFKKEVETQKNTTREWTHYEVHFQLCCARAVFRRCTLESLFVQPTQCTQEQALTLQKFSVIFSEGTVYQDCDHNMMYENCPDGDPRPTSAVLKQLMSAEADNSLYNSYRPFPKYRIFLCIILCCIKYFII